MSNFLVCYAFVKEDGYGFGHAFKMMDRATEASLLELKKELEKKHKFTDMTFTSVTKLSLD